MKYSEMRKPTKVIKTTRSHAWFSLWPKASVADQTLKVRQVYYFYCPDLKGLLLISVSFSVRLHL